MIYVIIAVFMLLVFGLCFLVDKLLQRLTRANNAALAGRSKVRLPRRGLIFGVIICVGALVVLLFLPARRPWLFYPLCGIILLLGLFLIYNHCATGIDYDETGFTYRQPFRKKQSFAFADIRGETAFAARSGVNATLYLGADGEVTVYSAMNGIQGFLRAAFNGWCRARGIDPESVSPPNPDYLVWFNEPVEEDAE